MRSRRSLWRGMCAPVLGWVLVGACAHGASVHGGGAASADPDEPRRASQPEMVAPETLSQGFVLVVRDESGQADENNPIYLASNKNGWDPGQESMRLEQRSDGRWQIVLDQPESRTAMQFKFTLGDWSRVERDAAGNDIENRTLPEVDVSGLEPGERPVIELVVESFRTPSPAQMAQLRVDPYRDLEVTGSVRRVQVAGGAGDAEAMTRQLLVWLPPGYDVPENASRRYPVLYLHDGQNLFEKLPGVWGEWHADETATRLIEQGEIEPAIIVGIPHGGASRVQEYVPLEAFRGIEPEGNEHVAWLRGEVMPRIESIFRVSTRREDTMIGGASLGAVISLYAAARHPDRFGGLLLESMPTLAESGGAWRRHVESIRGLDGARVFIGVGGREVSNDESDAAHNAAYVRWSRRVAAALEERAGADVRLVVEQSHNHNEDAWADRFDDAVRYLLGR